MACSLVAESPHTTSDPFRRILAQSITSQRGNYSTDCFRYNSQRWLQGPRLGNVNDTLDVSLARRLILDDSTLSMSQARQVLSRTICDLKSPFVSLQSSKETELAMIRYWKTRLVYLAIHHFQHHWAVPEVVLFHQAGCLDQQRTKHGVGPLDFECPDAKFLVVRLFSNGIGANMRLAAVPALMAGLATQRVVVFVNNAPVGPDFLQNPWKQVSCPRGDMQCFFMPSTPCVLTIDELAKAPTLRKDELRSIFRNGTLSEERQKERVLILHLSFRPQREPENVRRLLYELAFPLAKALVHESDEPERSIILQAAQDLLQPDPVSTANTTTYSYYGTNSPLFHGLLLYAMRPNTRAALSLQSIVKESLPKDYDVKHSIGLPIRATDKCDAESECLAFDQYVRSLQSLWTLTPSTSIVVTTESRQVIDNLNRFIDHQGNKTAFPARFVTNKHDILQDSGYLHHQHGREYTAQDAMLSAISSLKLQMATRRTVGNCCSNFHLLLADLLSEGCGLAHEQFICMQDHPDPEFRICCQWDKSSECQLRRNQALDVAF
jgi:hypothetical protein